MALYRTFNGVSFEVVHGAIDGMCTDPKHEHPTILINVPKANRKRYLEVLIHEALHACSFETREENVQVTAKDIADFLWKEGFRLKETKKG